ncbi:Phospholipid:diacylglycerol acyltransferase 1 [Linum perenne]
MYNIDCCRPLCWVEHMSLDNETGLDPSGIRVRPVSGLVAADYFAPGYFVWAVLIANLARIGYEENSMYTASYDWRLSFQNTEVRDRTLSRIESNIELMVSTNDGNKAVIIPHSMGVSYSLHFMKWVEAPAPMGGGGGPDWCSKHIKAVMNIGGPFLGVPKAVAGLFSAEARDIAVVSRRPFPSPSIIAAAAPSCSFHGVAPSLYPPSLPPSSLRPKPNSRRRSGSKSLPSQLVVVDPSSLSPLPSQLVVVDPSSLLSADSSLLSANSPKSGMLLRVKLLQTLLVVTFGQSIMTWDLEIDTSADDDSCLKDRVYITDGDETVPVLSAGYMCAKGWRGKTRFNPSGIRTYNREYDHSPPTNLLERSSKEKLGETDSVGI